MGKLSIKAGVDLGSTFPPAGARVLEVLKALVAGYAFDVVITSGRDGAHSGPDDPHHTGEAFDLRTWNLSGDQKRQLLMDLVVQLGPRFYAFLEAPGTGNEHIHVQRKKATVYSPLDYLINA